MDDAMRHRAMKRLWMTALVFALGVGFVAWTHALGLLPAWAALLQIGVWSVTLLVFFVLLSTGVVWNRHDPMLVFAQVLASIGATAVCYAVNPHWRGFTLQVLFVLLIFDMQRLSRKQIVVAGWTAVASMLVALAMASLLEHDAESLGMGLFFIGMAAVHVPLLSLLAGEVRGIRLRHEQSRAELDGALARLSELSVRDSLTGAFNRRHGLACIELELKRQGRRGKTCAIALIDLDHFKHINDHAGHQAGDAVLKRFAAIAKEACQPEDVFIRWGGEEFLLLMGQADDREAYQRVEALRIAVANHDWSDIVPGRAVTFSAGVAVPDARDDAAGVLARADVALYGAKDGGRNRVQMAGRDG